MRGAHTERPARAGAAKPCQGEALHMKKTGAAVAFVSGEGSAARCQDSESQDDKPPDCQPPDGGQRLFPGVAPRQWNDWRWQFKNRITRIDQLARYSLRRRYGKHHRIAAQGQ